jgi:hypothetical protein
MPGNLFLMVADAAGRSCRGDIPAAKRTPSRSKPRPSFAPFLRFFFGGGDAALPMDQLKEGVTRFKGFAMVCFGNFRFAYRRLSTIATSEALREALGPCCHSCNDIDNAYARRADKVLDISLIAREDTWFVGEVTGRKLGEELAKFDRHLKEHQELREDEQALAFGRRLAEMDAKFKTVQDVALRNTDVYLTWDHVDVYVATSMRNQWEYEEVFDFAQQLFGRPALEQLKLRYFDPTQSKCRTPRDKGLLEGLMLRRAGCTIYMAQEADTLGKDSELASTLAQGKPVIVYVPMIDSDEYATRVAERPLLYAKIRLHNLQASEIVDQVEGLPELADTFLNDFKRHRTNQPFELWTEKDNTAFKETCGYWPELCGKIAEAERLAFEKRALVLQKHHPLAIQLNLETGVANGVMVVRNIDECAELLKSILTNRATFNIQAETGGHVLVEQRSGSVFRAVTDNEKLTNSFWNLWN